MKATQATIISKDSSAASSLLPLDLVATPTRHRVRRKSMQLESFRPVTLEDMPIIWQYLKQEKGRTTDFSFGGLLMWVNYFNYEFAIVADTLFIKGVVENHREIPAFSLPIGRLPLSKSVPMVRDYCLRKGITPVFSAVPEYAMEEMRSLSPLKVEELTDWADYLYDAEKLATLSGKKLGKKRNHVNKFDSLYPEWTLEEMTPASAREAMEFMDVFDLEGDRNQSAVDERKLTRQLIEWFRSGTTEEIGALLKVNGKVAGFTIGDVKGDTLFVHIEKCTREFEGSYEKINKEFAAMVTARYPEIKYINREDDAGDDGLRYAKQSYHPIEMLKKYNVVF